ncbi:hypothetical protein [Amycolatopsis sp. Hca4]|uniref:hypothetical protein n=1 Tax=Amycolatopsis sp. Hca4 TaxID=2742131 RepID=UPI00159049EB|nr:hypothetical protein [Amycolatopsis sp. Hca4]QKV74537.1 hypothetical protein HUT10_12725 [Amycolatopsis sp. Hca4]
MADISGLQPGNLVMGPARLYIYRFAFDPTLSYEPALTDINLAPAASAWYDTGITLGGTNVNIAPTWTPLTGDQLVDKLGARLTDRDIKATANFAEMTRTNLAYAWNMTAGPTGANYAVSDLNAGQTANRAPYRTLLVDGLGPDVTDGSRSLKRRAILRKALPSGDTALNWEKANQQALKAEFQAFFVSESISPIRVIDEVGP